MIDLFGHSFVPSFIDSFIIPLLEGPLIQFWAWLPPLASASNPPIQSCQKVAGAEPSGVSGVRTYDISGSGGPQYCADDGVAYPAGILLSVASAAGILCCRMQHRGPLHLDHAV